EAGLNNTHSGNMSMRVNDEVIITRHGAMLGDLGEEDLVVLGLDDAGEDASYASTEFELHRSIYLGSAALAVIHTHPRSATALSLMDDEIVPIDLEGCYYFQRVPVTAVDTDPASEELRQAITLQLRERPLAVVKGHGAFAAAQNLEKCLQISHSLEWSCDIILRSRGVALSLKMAGDGDRRGNR
ncbi:fuculose phosphate aldolase, partial [bacterium]